MIVDGGGGGVKFDVKLIPRKSQLLEDLVFGIWPSPPPPKKKKKKLKDTNPPRRSCLSLNSFDVHDTIHDPPAFKLELWCSKLLFPEVLGPLVDQTRDAHPLPPPLLGL